MKDFKDQPFYEKLKSKTIRDTITVLSGAKYKKTYELLEYLIYGVLLYLIYLTIPSFIGNFDSTSLIILGIALALIWFLLPMVKKSQENYKSITDKYRDGLSKQVCNCSEKCNCTNELKEFLKSKKLKLL